MTKDARFIEGCEITFRNVKLRYPYLISPDTEYQEQWSTECILDPKDAKELKELGFNIKDSDEGPYIKVKRLVYTRNHKKQSPPVLVGRDPSVPFTEECGNGTLANVKCWAKYVIVKKEEHLPCYLNAVQVIEHQPKASNSGFENLEKEE